MISGTARNRIVLALYNLMKRFGEQKDGSIVINVKITHRLLGSIASLTRETVTNQLLSLQKEGLVKIDQGIVTILDKEKLKKEVAFFD